MAWREAWRLHRIEARDADRTVELAAAERVADPRLDPEPPIALRDALARLRPRQRRFLTMHAAGLRYEEMTVATGDSFRTVDRQLVRAGSTARRAGSLIARGRTTVRQLRSARTYNPADRHRRPPPRRSTVKRYALRSAQDDLE